MHRTLNVACAVAGAAGILILALGMADEPDQPAGQPAPQSLTVGAVAPPATVPAEAYATEPPVITSPVIEPVIVEPVTEPTQPPVVAEPVTEPTSELDRSYPDLMLPACLTDEVTDVDCYWDAAIMGNGLGTSFVAIDGVAYYPEGSS